VGCAIGHSLSLEPDPNKYLILSNMDFDYKRWADDYFGFNLNEYFWCFGSFWGKIDNSRRGAIIRMYALINGMVPYEYVGASQFLYTGTNNVVMQDVVNEFHYDVYSELVNKFIRDYRDIVNSVDPVDVANMSVD